MKILHCVRQAGFVLGLLLTLSSCKKDLPNQNLPQPVKNNGPLITRYEYAPNLYTLFNYNSAGQITRITDINDIARTDYTLTYKADGKVDKIATGNGYWKFTYNGDLLTRADSYINGNPASQGYYQFIYDGQNVTESLLYSNYGGSVIKPRSKIDFQYDANGDITRSDTYLWDITSGAFTAAGYQLYESDTHTDPVYCFRDVFAVLYRVVSPHNYTKAQFFYPDGTVNQDNTYQYTYNNNGYPVSALRRNLAAGTDGFVTLRFIY